jgi:hypothetical protein
MPKSLHAPTETAGLAVSPWTVVAARLAFDPPEPAARGKRHQ